MKIKTAIATITASLALAAALIVATPANAAVQASFGIRVNVAPPLFRTEAIGLRPSLLHVWVPGYWHWRDERRGWGWIGGSWVLPPHPRAIWVGSRCERRGSAWFYTRGHWR